MHIVSAATIEETTIQNDLIFNIVTNLEVEFFVRETLSEVEKLLKQCARKDNNAAD